MLELGAAICAGGAVAIAALCIALPGPLSHAIGGSLPRRLATRVWLRESALAACTGWRWLNGRLLLAIEAFAGVLGAAAAILLTGLPALGVAAFAGSIALVRVAAASRSHALRRERQDAVLESVRMLRQLLETGAGTVQQAIAILAERGPVPLRMEFRLIAATSLGRRHAWAAARARIAEPLFDMLAAAVLIQGPGGGELAPLFAELEATVTSAQEVEREAEALQVQARSAAARR
jgi:Flp pilus assembly protein TadB